MTNFLNEGVPFIEDAQQLNLDFENLKIQKILGMEKEIPKNVNVHDLVVDGNPTYTLSNGGLVHNGGGI